ncbi:EAL domain-containing protein (putative c-di-GMP-specific phosphodiesterase class I) [Palleronia aestuarii]|uniref:EAL domain-containing protein (Putative c-di-GMP-specific phosphodiesterase class I) n=1 Tax=Palleronia aestuarii TaxID=568105 RepID=A0A2W7N8U9_9RHOB|nr:EAL domain-containing protein [Palleronia aestuarii]PZX16611.1 EAL domain-containing protein (putative c-di-GMP-specific phosphodiesterase class I) [Palleronia aestuarii]
MALIATNVGRASHPVAPDLAGADTRPSSNDILRTVEESIEDDNALLAFQPVVPAGRPDMPAFYEGLIRVLDRNGRIIPAKDFIGQVEETEIGRRIDCLSLRRGLALLAQQPDLRIAINMSARSISFAPWRETLERGLTLDATVGERLILEITENSVNLMPQEVRSFITAMQDRGVSFALDGFGSGYTSMRHLKDIRFDILKIDGSFVRGICQTADNQAIVKAIVSIARHFDMVTIAECVELAEDSRVLRQIGVDCLQGYYFGAPTIRPRWAPGAERQG